MRTFVTKEWSLRTTVNNWRAARVYRVRVLVHRSLQRASCLPGRSGGVPVNWALVRNNRTVGTALASVRQSMEKFTTSQSLGTRSPSSSRLRAICWRLHRDGKRATCSLHSDYGQWELRLDVDGQVERSEFFRDKASWIATVLRWKSGLRERGWSERADPSESRLSA